MEHLKIYDELAEKDIRVSCIIHIASMLHSYAWPEEARDAIESWPEMFWKALGYDEGDLSKIEELLDDRDVGVEEVNDMLHDAGKLGFVVQAGTPVPTYTSLSGYSTYGYGHTHHTWVYGETLEECYEKIKEWRDNYHKQQKLEQCSRFSEEGEA